MTLLDLERPTLARAAPAPASSPAPAPGYNPATASGALALYVSTDALPEVGGANPTVAQRMVNRVTGVDSFQNTPTSRWTFETVNGKQWLRGANKAMLTTEALVCDQFESDRPLSVFCFSEGIAAGNKWCWLAGSTAQGQSFYYDTAYVIQQRYLTTAAISTVNTAVALNTQNLHVWSCPAASGTDQLFNYYRNDALIGASAPVAKRTPASVTSCTMGRSSTAADHRVFCWYVLNRETDLAEVQQFNTWVAAQLAA